MSFLEHVMNVISESELEVSLNIKNQGGGQVLLKIMPVVGQIKETATAAEKQLKAALSMPLKVVGTLPEIERELLGRIQTYQAVRSDWEKQVLDVEEMVSKAKAEKSKDKKPMPSEVEKGEKAQGTKKVEEPAAITENEDDFIL